ncbi:MAG: ABC transporter ATP-binding protein [Myxococcota bacterium]
MFLEVKNVAKAFGSEAVLHGVSLDVEDHEVLSILGRSGSGKTTLLKIIAGLEEQDRGEVWVAGERLDGRPPERRNVVYLYQEPLLFPHLDVYENVAFGLRLRGVEADAIESRVLELLGQVGLEPHVRKRPEQLSGGQRQRVAFARALIVDPRLLLLDEPFGALDSETRASMQELFVKIASERQIATLFVTHDLKEALVVGHRFAHIQSGTLVQFESRGAFLDDETIGAAREIDFWAKVREFS